MVVNVKKKEPRFKYGEEVEFLQWDELEALYGLDEDGNVKTLFPFTPQMAKLCGHRFFVVKEDNGKLRLNSDFDNIISRDMVRRVRLHEGDFYVRRNGDHVVVRDEVTSIAKEAVLEKDIAVDYPSVVRKLVDEMFEELQSYGLYSGRVICIEGTDNFTKGKIYEIVKGMVVDDVDVTTGPYKSFEEFQEMFTSAKFIEVIN